MLTFFGGVDPTIGCKIIRSQRPCLACPGKMDLVKVTQSVNFAILPICFVNANDILDCSSCGYSTSVESYDYLKTCKIGGPVMDRGAISSGNAFENCPSCSIQLSQQWKFCPFCGTELPDHKKSRQLGSRTEEEQQKMV